MDRTSMSSTSPRPFHSVAEILTMLQSVGYCSDLDVSSLDSTGSDSLGCQFDRILSSFLNRNGQICFLPATLGDGSTIDLFKFYSIVHREGGYHAVTKECKWKSVAEAMGLDSSIETSLKLVFLKYCFALDKWLAILENKKEFREAKRHKNEGTSFVSSSSCKTINYKMVSEPLPPLIANKDQFLTALVDSKSNAKDVVTLGGSSTSPRPFHSVAEILTMLQSVGYCSDLDVSSLDSTGSDSLGCQFDRILSSFLNRSGQVCFLPATLGDGSPIDLFKFYSMVHREGGYDAVTKECKWKSVAEAMGLDSSISIATSLKLVFLKYCFMLDKWLAILENNKEFREAKRHKNEGTSFVSSSSCKTINYRMVGEPLPPLITNKDQFLTALVDAKSNAKDVVILGGSVANGGSNHKKRKKPPPSQMLNWLRKVAANPYHPSLSNTSTSNKSKNNSSAVGKFYAQALLARQARSFRRNSRSSPNMLLLQVGRTEQSKAARSNEKFQSERRLSRDLRRAKIPIGAKFQAVIPDWTGRPSRFCTEFDTLKWLGTCSWPPENQRTNRFPCQCERPQSAECVRCHIAEKRQQLKCELGSAFHDWGFEGIGEEAASSWTEEEEKKFRDVVFKNQPSLNKNFWDELNLNFPSKTRKSLVSYYFNVFLLGWRRYQNYVTPKNIDSDDEVTEFDFANHSLQNHLSVFRMGKRYR